MRVDGSQQLPACSIRRIRPVGFRRTVEDFCCEQCGAMNEGNGYTNHCSRCLYSKHVDRSPGDRLNPCQGLMAPMELRVKRDSFVVVHRCLACGQVQTCRTSPDDDLEPLLRRTTLG
jgi:RNHCP domain